MNFISAFFFITTLTLGNNVFDSQKTSFDYNDFETINNDTFFSKNDDTYGIYIYNEHCSNCNDIKQSILNFISKNKEKIYLYDTALNDDAFITYESNPSFSNRQNFNICVQKNIGVSSITQVYSMGTPELILISKDQEDDINKISSMYIGSENIQIYIQGFSYYIPLIVCVSIIVVLIFGIILTIILYRRRNKNEK